MGDIHDACERGDLELVRRLVSDNPEVVDADDEHNWRPIFHASLRKRFEVVKFLLESGADLSAHDGYVMHYAGEVSDNKPIVGLLVSYGGLDSHVRPGDDLSRQLLAAIFLADKDRVDAMLNLHPSLVNRCSARGDQPIHHASRNGDAEIVQALIDHGADVNARNDQGHTVLYCAGGHGHAATVQCLLNKGADPSVKFTHDGKNLVEWLAQYPDDTRFTGVSQILKVDP